MKIITLAAAAALLALGACSDGGDKAATPAAPAASAVPAPPPLPELPMTLDKSVLMLANTSLTCQSVASLRFEMNRCEQKIGQGPDDEGFRQELADLRTSLQGKTEAQMEEACGARFAELQQTPMPRACWGDRYK